MSQWCDFYLAQLIHQEIIKNKSTILQLKTHPYLKLSTDNSIPDFRISVVDLSPKIVRALMGYDAEERSVILKQVGVHVFADYYRLNLQPLLEVKLVG